MAFVTSLTGLPVSLLALLTVTSGFNLNADLARVWHGANNTNFGYSVALWADQGGNLRIVIGAPKGTNSTYGKGIYPLGNIHMCPPYDSECTTDTRLPELSQRDNSSQAIDYGETIKSQGIGFGETLYTTDALNSKLVACVPRYPRRVNKGGYTALQPRGACFVLRDMYDQPVKVMPYKDECFYRGRDCYKNSNVYTGYALHGFSATLTPDQRDVFMGGPYAFYGQGQVARAKSGDGKVSYYNKQIYDGAEFDFDTEGWATVVGKFDGSRTHVATSKIGASSSKGAVKFYTSLLSATRTPDLIGEESGDRFGFSLAVGDVDGDGADDLVVGAPMAQAPTHVADHGKVYVYYAPTKTVSPRSREVLLGKVAWGRFGHAVTSPGDLNQDGYADVVVGAPFDEGGGNIYIYNGGENGLLTEYTQHIAASEFPEGLRSFGFSFDGGLDIDGNGFPDLVVGAPISNAAVLIRTAPVVHLEGSIHFDPRVIPMGNKSCNVGGQPVVCFRIEVSLQHRTKGVDFPINISFSFELDSKQRRLAFLETNNHSFTVARMVNSVTDSADSWYLEAYVKEERPRFDIPLVLSTNVSLVPYEEPDEFLPLGGEESVGRRGEVVRLPPRVPRVFDVLKPFSSETKARLECEDASSCFSKPDLILQAKSQHEELLLSDGNLNLELDLQVLNATAYSTRIEVTYTSDLIFQRVSGSRFLPTCQPSAYAEDKGVRKEICTFSYNLKRNFEMDATFHFEYNALTLINGGLKRLNLTFEVASDIADRDATNNIVLFDLPVTSRIDLYAEGVSNIENVDARANETLGLKMLTNHSNEAINRTQLGPLTTHTFSLTNRGPSPLLFAEMVVSVPVNIRNLPLLYLADNPVMSSSLSCSVPQLNPLGFNFTSDRRGETTEISAEGPLTTSPAPISSTMGSRKKREMLITARDDPKQKSSNVTKKITTLGCSEIPCGEIRCNVSSLLPDDTVYIHITTYVTAATIKLFGKSSVVIESSMTVATNQANVKVTHGSDKVKFSSASTHVTFIEHKDGQASFKDLSVWKMIVAIVVGLMLVIIVSAIMHKLGFFKRKRLTKEQKTFLKKSAKRKTMT